MVVSLGLRRDTALGIWDDASMAHLVSPAGFWAKALILLLACLLLADADSAFWMMGR